MKHSQIDEFAVRSPYHLVDPRIKLVGFIAFLIAVAMATVPEASIFVLAVSLTIAGISKIPVKHLASLSIVSLPFIVATTLGAIVAGRPESAIYVAIRIFSSVLVAVVFASTTPLFEQIRALQFFRVPKIMTTMILFTYRFVFVFIDEMERMKLARKARGFKGGSHMLDRGTMSTIGHTIGMLFIRVNERAGRVFDSLTNRGFSGTALTRRRLELGVVDAAYSLMIFTMISMVALLQLGVVRWPI